MTQESLPQDVRRFVLTSVASVAYLEALLLLLREPEQPWDATRLAHRLYISEKKSSGLLQALLDAGLVIPAGQSVTQYCYRPVTPELGEMVERLAKAYASNLVAITNLIHSTHNRKAEKFAHAFVWRKDS